MNEAQYGAHVAVEHARSRLAIAAGEAEEAREGLLAAAIALRAAVVADPDSWRGTPGVEEYPTTIEARHPVCPIDHHICPWRQGMS